MQQVGYYQVNLVAQQIRSNINTHLEERDSQVLAIFQFILDLTSSSSSSISKEEVPTTHQANVLVDQTQLGFLLLMKDIV